MKDPGTPGVARALFNISVRPNLKEDPQAGGHEIGHTLGIKDKNSGIMNGGNTGDTQIYKDDIQDIINFSILNNTSNQNKITTHGNLPKNGKVKNRPK